jgi:precorrin-6B methylase 2
MSQSQDFVEENLGKILSAIKNAAPDLHKAGAFRKETLDALAKHLGRQKVVNSIETGSGASTLLFSHLSQHHTVFALDEGNESISNIRYNPLLRTSAVTFVEGPTQKTLPTHQFPEPLQAALIDGPHGYPFPDLEYYFVYPHLETGALLVIDDIQIRSIRNLFNFLRVDRMFHLEEVVGTTAFFRRTEAPTLDPLGDGWWEQKYNQVPPLAYLPRHIIRRMVPTSLVRWLRHRRK